MPGLFSLFYVLDILEQWKQSSESATEIIICTDAVTKELLISDATNVIHYELPRNLTQFGTRFSTMWKWFRGPQDKSWVRILISHDLK